MDNILNEDFRDILEALNKKIICNTIEYTNVRTLGLTRYAIEIASHSIDS